MPSFQAYILEPYSKMSSLPPFQFATLTRTHTSCPSGDEAAPPALPASLAAGVAPAPSLLNWPAELLRVPAQREFADDYELKIEDIDEADRDRFRRELAGRCYAAHWPYDRELDVWRRVFLSYPETVQMGLSPCDPRHHSDVFGRDLRQAREDIQILITAPAQPVTLQRADAECDGI
jgi:hypothetical protein